MQEISQGINVHGKLLIKTWCLKQNITRDKNMLKTENKNPKIIAWPIHQEASELLNNVLLLILWCSSNAWRWSFQKYRFINLTGAFWGKKITDDLSSNLIIKKVLSWKELAIHITTNKLSLFLLIICILKLIHNKCIMFSFQREYYIIFS